MKLINRKKCYQLFQNRKRNYTLRKLSIKNKSKIHNKNNQKNKHKKQMNNFHKLKIKLIKKIKYQIYSNYQIIKLNKIK